MTNETITPSYGDYDTPSDLVNDRSLSQDKKISLLKIWEEDASSIAEAASEGMVAEEGAPPPMLSDVRAALKELEDTKEAYSRVHGEGNAEADQRYRSNLKANIKDGGLEGKAREAANAVKNNAEELSNAVSVTAEVGPKGRSAKDM